MTLEPSTTSEPTILSCRQVFEQGQLSASSPSPPNAMPHTRVGDIQPHVSTFAAKPFDRFRPRGGGAEGDIFRRFKLLASEEEDFVLHWTRQRRRSGIITRDEDGTLVFRISLAHISELKDVGIGPSDMQAESVAQWSIIYDEEGISWLTQFRCMDLEDFPKIYDTSGQPIRANGRIGRYGPSGMTPGDFVAQMRLESRLAEVRETL